MRITKRICMLGLALLMLVPAGCGKNNATGPDDEIENAFIDPVEIEEIELQDEAVALAAAPIPVPVSDLLMPEASGTLEKKNSKAIIDYSNTQDGYVMAKFTAQTTTRLKVRVAGPTNVYDYDLVPGVWTTFGLSDGNGSYTVKVFQQNTNNTKYATVLSVTFDVALSDEFAPFLRPNQYVDYAEAENTIALAAELAGELSDPLEKVKVIYEYVVNNFTYDKAKAQTVKSGYLPVLEDVLAAKTGICFDYAALMTAMLRSQGVPCKLVVGFAGTAYHAWVSVWTEESGWVDGAIFFDGTTWHRMDPTFASSGKSSKAVMQYIGDGENYSTKYLY